MVAIRDGSGNLAAMTIIFNIKHRTVLYITLILYV